MTKSLVSVLLIFLNLQNIVIHCSKENETKLPQVPTYQAKSVQELKNLPRRDPGKVGDTVKEEVESGRIQTLITRAINPPIFELPDFLTHQECDNLIDLAQRNGMRESKLFGKETHFSKDKSRKTLTTFIKGSEDEILRRIRKRAIALTKLPENIVYNSEPLQIGHYPVGGFYKFHCDSEPVPREIMMTKPCCHFVKTQRTGNKCTLCRYVTILMYLNDVEEGGETAFPVADQPSSKYTKKVSNMTFSCANGPVIVAPKKGKALMWYNNIVDPEYGWLGVFDKYAVHGGCPVLKGDKWFSNLWINAPQHHSVDKKSIYHDEL